MPIYEYKCENCRKRTERIQKISDPPLKKCPHCGGPLRKLISSPAIQFSGSGFYINDYAKKTCPPGEPKRKTGLKKESGPPAGTSSTEKSGSE